MFKKEYEAPKMDIVDLKMEAPLLGGSGPEGVTEYDDEFGCNYNPDMDRKA
ncbi:MULTISPECIES: hypothetical protein [unclassified Fibrobacter]|uniref:hypothetical protein n=1 Tax=unclassified Fibrobacter TaxID=2634177 RepID=UPI000D7B6F2E|nr:MULTISPECIES: hypothetical protein [unclassified Fibrobacter]PWJ68516.1 hypothetical protein BGX12_10742 [Fibrobacter sp. UWR4]PZW72092.1 hypothetical protein C8E88_100864 [Fibrobacter sp. UWR1]